MLSRRENVLTQPIRATVNFTHYWYKSFTVVFTSCLFVNSCNDRTVANYFVVGVIVVFI
jgi:hypothetical protein